LKVIPFLRKRSHRFKGIDFMTLVPAQAVDHELSTDSSTIVLLLPRFASGILGRFVQPRLPAKKKLIRIPLEKRGQWLWENMDGVRTIGDLVPGFADKFPNDQEQVPIRLAAFLYRMEENGFIHLG
jgi:hypothetical protein